MDTRYFSVCRKALLVAGLSLSAALSGCGDSDALAKEAKEKADATCACKDFDCTKQYIIWFNKTSITQDDDIKSMSAKAQQAYKADTLRAADCQDKLRS